MKRLCTICGQELPPSAKGRKHPKKCPTGRTRASSGRRGGLGAIFGQTIARKRKRKTGRKARRRTSRR